MSAGWPYSMYARLPTVTGLPRWHVGQTDSQPAVIQLDVSTQTETQRQQVQSAQEKAHLVLFPLALSFALVLT